MVVRSWETFKFIIISFFIISNIRITKRQLTFIDFNFKMHCCKKNSSILIYCCNSSILAYTTFRLGITSSFVFPSTHNTWEIASPPIDSHMKIRFFQDLPSDYQDHFLLHDESLFYHLHVGEPSFVHLLFVPNHSRSFLLVLLGFQCMQLFWNQHPRHFGKAF